MSTGRRRQPRTLAEWLAGLERTGWKGRKAGREHVGPCPLCGGTDRFHVGPGSRVPVLAGCRHGCTFEALAKAVHGPAERRRGPGRPDWTRNRPKARRGPENGLQGDSGASGGVRGETEARKSPVRRPGDLPRGRGTPENRPKVEDHSRRMNTARRLWERSGPVPLDPKHPARRWSARRNLWPPDRPWPDAVRWLNGSAAAPSVCGLGDQPTALALAGNRAVPSARGGSLVAAFAPLADWLSPKDGTAGTSGNPDTVGVVTLHRVGGPRGVSGVQLLHVDADGRPRLDRPKSRGGRAKRSRGSMAGAVCVIGKPAGSGTLHVVEGIADALAVAAREDGAAVATGGAGGFKRLAPDLAARARPVLIHADGDPAGIVAARRLLAALTRRGIAGAVRTHPPGCDPAQPTR